MNLLSLLKHVFRVFFGLETGLLHTILTSLHLYVIETVSSSVLSYQFCFIFSQMAIATKAAVALSQRYGTQYEVGSIIDVICKCA
jgi:hypothetical protein